MALLATQNPTLLDLAKTTDPMGKVTQIIEILNQQNEILEDMTWMEGNLPTGHRTTIRTGLPTATWRRLYEGIQPSKSTKAQVDESTGMLEALAEVDKALVDLNGNTAAFRLSEDRAFLEAMNQQISTKLFYGDNTEPESFVGLSPRFNSLSAPNADNIIDAGGTGSDNRSIWLIVWSPETCFGLIPKNSQAGWQMKDMGEVVIENVDGQNGRMLAYRTHYRWDAGLCVKDWRYVVRIANIDRSELTSDASSGANLHQLMFRAMELIPNMSVGRPVFYMSRDLRTFLGEQTANGVKNSTLTMENVGGVMTRRLNGIPVRRVDTLAGDEARVT